MGCVVASSQLVKDDDDDVLLPVKDDAFDAVDVGVGDFMLIIEKELVRGVRRDSRDDVVVPGRFSVCILSFGTSEGPSKVFDRS